MKKASYLSGVYGKKEAWIEIDTEGATRVQQDTTRCRKIATIDGVKVYRRIKQIEYQL